VRTGNQRARSCSYASARCLQPTSSPFAKALLSAELLMLLLLSLTRKAQRSQTAEDAQVVPPPL
jgi:hypothetical protein